MSASRSRPAVFGAAPDPAARRTAPGSRAIDRAWLAALAALALIAQWLWMDASVGAYDEGLLLVGADRVLRGDVPYRDFWTLYGPASFYLEAALFRVFGETALVGRALDAVVKASIVGLTFAIVLRFGRRALAAAAAVLVLGLLVYLRNYGVPLFPAVCASLVAVLALHDVAAHADRRAALVAGIAVGIAILFRHDLGAYALIGCLVFFARGGAAMPRGEAVANGAAAADGAAVADGATVLSGPVNASRRGDRRSLALRFAIGVLAIVGPVALVLLRFVPLHDLYENLIRIPLVVYPQVRALPFPSLADAIGELVHQRSLAALGLSVVYLPLVASAIAIAIEVLRRRADGIDTAPPAGALTLQLLLLLNVLFFAKGLVRVSPLHMGASLVVSVILLAASAARAQHALWRHALAGIGALACAGLVAKPFVNAGERSAQTGVSAGTALLSDRWISHASTLCGDASVPRLRCLRLDPQRMAVARWLLEHGGRGRRVYIGTGRHDKLFVNDVALYFAAEAVAPTRWHDLHPGVQTTRATQAAMIAELEASPLAYVVLDTEWDDRQEPNDSARSSGVTLLDDWLRDRFKPVFTAGSLTVMAPAESSVQAGPGRPAPPASTASPALPAPPAVSR